MQHISFYFTSRFKFESEGDADLEGANDVCAVASLMKQFFRELKDPLIPDILIDRMIRVKQQFDFDSPGFIKQLRPLLDELQPINYVTLKYVVQFLLLVSSHEANNKMSVLSLAIVLGPSLFRSAPGMTGLREQGIITPILIKFIQHSHDLFNRANPSQRVTHRLLNTSELSEAPEAPQKPAPPPKPKRKPHLFAPPTSQDADNKIPSQILLTAIPSHLLAEESVSLREVMSPWQSRLKSSPASPCTASCGSFKSELQLLVKEAIDLHMWGAAAIQSEEEETSDTPRSHNQDKKVSVKSLVSQFEDSSVVYGTAFRLSDLPSGLSKRLKHSASNYDLHNLARGAEEERQGQELFTPAHSLEFLTLERPRGPSDRKAPSRETRAKQSDFSNSELDSFFGVDTPGDAKNNSTTNNTNNSTFNYTANSTVNSTVNITTNSTMSSSHMTNITHLSQSTITPTNQSADKQVDTLGPLSPSQLKLVEELRGVKREIRNFQLEFRQKNGRKPTAQERECIRPLVQRYSEIKSQLGVTSDNSKLDGTISPATPKHESREGNGGKTLSPQHTNETAWKYKIEMNTIANTLLEKRKQSGRPAQIQLMTLEQLRQEKRDLQKSLLVYEGKYGRPQGEAVIVMRPLYDRYRAIKQFLHKYPDGRSNALQGKSTSMVSLNSLHHTENTLSTICASLGSAYPPDTLQGTARLGNNTTDQMQVQQNPSVLSLQSIPSACSVVSPAHRFPSPIEQDSNPSSLRDFSLVSTLHEFKEFLATEVNLKPQDYWLSHHYIRARKKELKNKLQEFEKEFKDKYERKPNKNDRECMLNEYREYRSLKDKMSFLESNFNVSNRVQSDKNDNGVSP